MSRRGWALFVSLGVVWGVPYLFIRIAVESLSPAMVVFTRVILAAALLLPVAAARGQLRPVLARWPWLLLFAICEIAIPFCLLSWAEIRLPSGLTGLLVAAVPLVSGLAARLLRLEDALDRRRLVGLLVGIVGVACLVGFDVRGGDLLGALAVLGAAVGYAFGPIIVSQRLDGVPSIGVIALALGVNAVLYAPFAWATRPGDVAAVPAKAWASVAVLGVLCSAIAFLLLFALVGEVGPSRATVITYVNPAVAVALGVAVLGEPFTAGIALGFPLVLLGSWLGTRQARRPVEQLEPAPA